jgi:YgiT-type zinc finger domain-containing protein
MKCVVCHHGETRAGGATITLDRDDLTLVVRNVPAQICETCGEEYVAEPEAKRLLDIADQAAQAGVRVDVRDYVAA